MEKEIVDENIVFDNSNTSESTLEDGSMPKKKYYRSRAHCNPFSHNFRFEYPENPNLMNWKTDHFPSMSSESDVPNILDIGCGFGGLTLSLAKMYPQKYVLGLEIRPKVTEFVRLRIISQRKENPGLYQNCSVLRSNSMKYMTNFFKKNSIDKMFFCFPDPHFKRKNYSRRIISERLLTEYAYFLKPNGRLYCITDVEDLHEWHVEKCNAHPLFQRLSTEDMSKDECVHAMNYDTEESKKVDRAGSAKYYAVFERIEYSSENYGNFDIHERFWNDDQFGINLI